MAEGTQRAWDEREQLLLTHADYLLAVHGYLGLNLDELAERGEYSKATIYNHFQSKEDLVVAVSTRHCLLRGTYFQYALKFEGLTREKMLVIGVGADFMARQYPHNFQLSQLAQTSSIWEKASQKTQDAFISATVDAMIPAGQVIAEAIEKGDLDPGYSDNLILCGLASLTKGAHLLGDQPMLPGEGVVDGPSDLLTKNYQIYADGLNWRPLSSDHDYAETEARIRAQFFAD